MRINKHWQKWNEQHCHCIRKYNYYIILYSHCEQIARVKAPAKSAEKLLLQAHMGPTLFFHTLRTR